MDHLHTECMHTLFCIQGNCSMRKVPILGYPKLVGFGVSLAVETKFKSVTRISKLWIFSLNLSIRESPEESGEIKW